MVTQKRIVSYMEKSDQIAREAGTDKEAAERVIKAIERDIEKNRRRTRPPAPEGGITLMDASRKYNIPPATLSDWLRYGWVNLIMQSGKFKFLNEADIIKLSHIDRSAGHSTLSKVNK